MRIKNKIRLKNNMRIKNNLNKNMDFKKIYKKYESVIIKYARQLSNEIGRPEEFDDYKQVGAIALFYIFKNPEYFQILSTAYINIVLKNSIRYYRRQNSNYYKKIILRNDIYYKPSIRYLASNSLNLYKSGNIFYRFEDKIIQRIDVMRIIKEFKSQNVKKISIYWINGLNGVQISNILNISKQAIYKIIKKIKENLILYCIR